MVEMLLIILCVIRMSSSNLLRRTKNCRIDTFIRTFFNFLREFKIYNEEHSMKQEHVTEKSEPFY
jgi:hypothetical protein